MNELFEACHDVAGSDASPIHAPARAGEVLRSVIDPALRASASWGGSAEVSLTDGLRATWESIGKE